MTSNRTTTQTTTSDAEYLINGDIIINGELRQIVLDVDETYDGMVVTVATYDEPDSPEHTLIYDPGDVVTIFAR